MSQRTYLCLQRSTSGKCDTSPSEMEQMYAKFNAWKEKFQHNIIDMGGKLGAGKIVSAEDTVDGPFVEAKEIIGGYMLISASTLEEAIEVVRESPGVVMPGSSVEIREITTP